MLVFYSIKRKICEKKRISRTIPRTQGGQGEFHTQRLDGRDTGHLVIDVPRNTERYL